MAPPRIAPRALRLLALVLAAVVVGLAPTTAAHADPTVAQIEAEIRTAWNKLEPLIEEYNGVHNELTKFRKKSAQLEKAIAPLRVTVEVTRTRVGAIAAQYYISGRTSTLNALLSSGSPANFTTQLELLDHMAKTKKRQISATTEAKAKFDDQKAALDKLIVEQAKKDADLAARKKVIEAEVNRLQALRLKAYGGNKPGGSFKIGVCPALAAVTAKAAKAVDFACRQIGKRYVFGSNGPDTFDCSGLTQQAWAAAGVSLDHYTKDQWRYGGTHVSSSARLPGDLVFFYPNDGLHHVGLYVGNGIMVHAPHTGDWVRMAYVSDMPLAGYVRPRQ